MNLKRLFFCSECLLNPYSGNIVAERWHHGGGEHTNLLCGHKKKETDSAATDLCVTTDNYFLYYRSGHQKEPKLVGTGLIATN